MNSIDKKKEFKQIKKILINKCLKQNVFEQINYFG